LTLPKEFQHLSSLFIGFVYAATVSLIIRAIVLREVPLQISDFFVVLALVMFIASDWAIRYRVRYVVADRFKAWQGIAAMLLEVATIYFLSASLVSFALGMRSTIQVPTDVFGQMTCYSAFAFFAFLSWLWNLLLTRIFGEHVCDVVKSLVIGDALRLRSAKIHLCSALRFRDRCVDWAQAFEDRWKELSEQSTKLLQDGGHVDSLFGHSAKQTLLAGLSRLVNWTSEIVGAAFSVLAQAVALHISYASLHVGVLLFIANQLRGDRPLLILRLVSSDLAWLQIILALLIIFFPPLLLLSFRSRACQIAGAAYLTLAMLVGYTTLTSLGLLIVLMLQQVAASTVFQMGLPYGSTELQATRQEEGSQ